MLHITVIALNFLSDKKVRGSKEDRYSGNKGVACFLPTIQKDSIQKKKNQNIAGIKDTN